jgi:hypothetical protein
MKIVFFGMEFPNAPTNSAKSTLGFFQGIGALHMPSDAYQEFVAAELGFLYL